MHRSLHNINKVLETQQLTIEQWQDVFLLINKQIQALINSKVKNKIDNFNIESTVTYEYKDVIKAIYHILYKDFSFSEDVKNKLEFILKSNDPKLILKLFESLKNLMLVTNLEIIEQIDKDKILG